MEQTSSSGSKKIKVDVSGGAGGEVVKQEIKMEEAVGELVAVDGAAAGGEITVRISKAKLHCPLCTLPLKPPIFKCDAGHLACSACDGLLSGNHCYACDGIGSYGREPALENLLRSVRVPCPNDVYGCRAYVVYYEAGDGEHRRACPCAPCCCPERERGCRFVGSPPMLADHIAAEHSSPVVVVRYGEESSLVLTAARRWHALVGQEDRSLFLVSQAAPCSDDTAVSLVCVRGNTGGGAAHRYKCRLALELPSGVGDGDEDEGGVVVMEYGVRSSALPSGTPALDQRAFLGLHQQLKAGHTLALSVRIDRLQRVGAAAGNATA